MNDRLPSLEEDFLGREWIATVLLTTFLNPNIPFQTYP